MLGRHTADDQGRTTDPTTEPLFTMAPPPALSISGISYFMHSHTLVRLRATAWSPFLLGRADDAGARPYEPGVIKRVVQAAILVDRTP